MTDHDDLKRLSSEFKDVVRVSLTSPIGINYDHGGSSENKDSSNKVSGKQINIEVIVISSDDESETSDVEDVTDKWRAKREAERRKMMEKAEEID